MEDQAPDGKYLISTYYVNIYLQEVNTKLSLQLFLSLKPPAQTWKMQAEASV